MATATIELGPKDQGGYHAKATRALSDRNGPYYHNWVDFDLFGVSEIRMDKPETKGFEGDNLIFVEFVNGESITFMGVITEVE